MCLVFLDELYQGHAQELADEAQFAERYAALTSLDLGYDRLGQAEGGGDLRLRDVPLSAEPADHGSDDDVVLHSDVILPPAGANSQANMLT